jgi:alpha-beta hydrolase superfamily lysophospholipase
MAGLQIQIPFPLPPAARIDDFFASRHGYRLCSTKWIPRTPDTPVRGAVVFCHGYTDYLGPHWDHIATLLSSQGLACFGLEHRGHGRSDGLIAYVPSFEEVVTDYVDWCAVIRDQLQRADANTNLPLFVWAESMGGAIAVRAAMRDAGNTFAGVLLQAPMLGLDAIRRPHWFVEGIARYVKTAPVCFVRPSASPVHAFGRMIVRCAPSAAILPPEDDMDVACFSDPEKVSCLRENDFDRNNRMCVSPLPANDRSQPSS